MDFTSHTNADLQHLLKTIGVGSIEELIARIIPADLRLGRPLNLPECLPEASLAREFKALAGENLVAADGLCFLGGGAYDHYIPAAVAAITGRPEFQTAYTPYQAEVSQGTLQTIYEYQTMVARLTGMDAANASHYDGATALAEGALMSVATKGKRMVAVTEGLNPWYRQALETYCGPAGIEVRTVKAVDGRIDLEALKGSLDGVSALLIQQPNFFGLLEPVEEAAALAKAADALVVSSTNPMTLALLKSPGDWGADIATAEGQPFGIPMSLGGSYLGMLATKKAFVRKMPGRIVGRTVDKNGKDGFVLTLQTREQHIRRQDATSNICSNQALMALSSLVYMSLMGRDGLVQAAEKSYRGAHYLAEKVAAIPGCRLKFGGEFFSEFVVELPRSAAEVIGKLTEKKLLAGPALSRWFKGCDKALLIAVTEKRTREDLDALAAGLKEVCA